MARLVDLDRQREAVRQERERMQRDSEELTTGIRETSGREYFMTRAATSAFGRHQQFQHWADENERPPQPPRSWFADGLGDRERSLRSDDPSLAYLMKQIGPLDALALLSC